MGVDEERKKNTRIFEDTMAWFSKNEKLQEAIIVSLGNQKIYLETDEVAVPENRNFTCQTVISTNRSLEAACEYARAGKKVCVQNLASATNPKATANLGQSLQEASLCKCTTLCPCLDSEECWQRFYLPHKKARNMLRNDDCIYTPGVIVVKEESSFPERMEEKDWYSVDIISCAAPNLRHVPDEFRNPGAGDSSAKVENSELYQLLLKRIERIFRIAALNGAEVLILGPFGCQVYYNPPEIVAKVFKAVQEKYASYFETIEYAVYCDKGETKYYDPFCEVFFGTTEGSKLEYHFMYSDEDGWSEHIVWKKDSN